MKRIFDLFISCCALVFLCPLFLCLSLLIRIKLGSPVLYRQVRPGLHGKVFAMYKFRTMTNETDKDGILLPDDKRLTALGSFLRKSSLDELPELWNVFKGDMSLVGPRPLLVEYLPLYNEHQQRRHEVKPGITGWAQVNGRNSISWEDKFELDVWYVENYNFLLDLKILFMTVLKVFKREGISASGHVTAYPFTGNDNEGKNIQSGEDN